MVEVLCISAFSQLINKPNEERQSIIIKFFIFFMSYFLLNAGLRRLQNAKEAGVFQLSSRDIDYTIPTEIEA
jgi:hypothetical protein